MGGTDRKHVNARIKYNRYFVVGILALVYALNFIDRQILSILAQPIKIDLRLTDAQLGALTGLTFALFYTAFGIPVALLADRGNRVKIIAVSSAIWSMFTLLSGMASTFAGLALARIGVGIGEAGASPASYSIISDIFPPKERARGLALYSLGVPLGSFLGIGGGAWLAASFGWRSAFQAIGLVGLIFAGSLMFIIREPARERIARSQHGGLADIIEAIMYFLRSPVLLLNALAAGLNAFVSYGILNWAPAYLQRSKQMTLADTAGAYALASSVAIGLGIFLGGYCFDRLGTRRAATAALLPAASVALIVPFLFAFTAASSWVSALTWLFAPILLSTVYLPAALTTVQNRTPPHRRATMSAILLFSLNLIGLGFGPLFVGVVSDVLRPYYGAEALGYALRWLTPVIAAAVICQVATAWLIRKEASSIPRRNSPC